VIQDAEAEEHLIPLGGILSFTGRLYVFLLAEQMKLKVQMLKSKADTNGLISCERAMYTFSRLFTSLPIGLFTFGLNWRD